MRRSRRGRFSTAAPVRFFPGYPPNLSRGIFAPAAGGARRCAALRRPDARGKSAAHAARRPRPPLPPPLILASRSAARAALLRAGAACRSRSCPPPSTRRRSRRRCWPKAAPPRDIADALAELKARRVAGRRPDRLVLGADQVLVCDGRHLRQAARPRRGARAAARRCAAGRTSCSRPRWSSRTARPVWRHVGRAQLTMRPFSDAFLDAYLAEQGDDAARPPSAPTGSRTAARSCSAGSQGDYLLRCWACRCWSCWASCAPAGSAPNDRRRRRSPA